MPKATAAVIHKSRISTLSAREPVSGLRSNTSFHLLLLRCLLVLSPAFSYAQTCQINIASSTTAYDYFVVNANGTVTDTKTSLMWKRCSEGQTWNGVTCVGDAHLYNWQWSLQQAQTVVNSGGFAGFTDWRVPNIKELRSIVEKRCYDPSINLSIFPNTTSVAFWTSSPDAYTGLNAWQVNFTHGNDSWSFKENNSQVRLVRSTR